MPLDQRIGKLGAPLYRLFKKKGLSSSGKQSSVVRSNPQAGRVSNVDCEPSASPLPSLPVELWTKIIHESDRWEWIALCSVCWLLCRIAQPFLYENIALWEDFYRDSLYGCIGDPAQFERTIDQRPELGEYVRSLHLQMDSRPVPIYRKRSPRLFGLFSYARSPLPDIDDRLRLNHRERYYVLFELSLFPNLESLHVQRIHFDLEFCNLIHSHPRLKSVTLSECTLDDSLASARIDRDHFPHSSISTVKVLYPKQNQRLHAWAALAPAKLESLTVVSTFPASDAGLILNRIREANKTSCLTTLSLDTYSPAVVDFLIASPQLRHLIYDTWMMKPPSSLMFSSLPADAIPFLEEYRGPAEISSTFFRGRPVRTVKFFLPRPLLEDRLVETLISLRYSAVPLTSLGFSLLNKALGPWLSHIPVTVRYLAVDNVDWLDFEKWLPALSHLTSLQIFSFKFGTMLHREEVMKICDTCPSLRGIDDGNHKWLIRGQDILQEPLEVLRQRFYL